LNDRNFDTTRVSDANFKFIHNQDYETSEFVR